MKKSSIWIELSALLIISGGIFFGVKSISKREVKSPLTISKKSQKKIGEVLRDGIFAKNPEIKNRIVVKSVKRIYNRLKKKISKPAHKYDIYVVKSSTINAVTLPGGVIIVFSKLIDTIDSAEELAGVIAHELGHAQKGHISKRLISALSLRLVTMILSGGDSVLIGEIIEKFLGNKYNREQEEEADDYALALMTKARINPHYLGKVFRKFKNAMPKIPSVLNIFSTHPNNDERIENALAFELPKDFKEKKIKVNWKAVQAQL